VVTAFQGAGTKDMLNMRALPISEQSTALLQGESSGGRGVGVTTTGSIFSDFFVSIILLVGSKWLAISHGLESLMSLTSLCFHVRQANLARKHNRIRKAIAASQN